MNKPMLIQAIDAQSLLQNASKRQLQMLNGDKGQGMEEEWQETMASPVAAAISQFQVQLELAEWC